VKIIHDEGMPCFQDDEGVAGNLYVKIHVTEREDKF
jgi:hypothetical protein